MMTTSQKEPFDHDASTLTQSCHNADTTSLFPDSPFEGPSADVNSSPIFHSFDQSALFQSQADAETDEIPLNPGDPTAFQSNNEIQSQIPPVSPTGNQSSSSSSTPQTIPAGGGETTSTTQTIPFGGGETIKEARKNGLNNRRPIKLPQHLEVESEKQALEYEGSVFTFMLVRADGGNGSRSVTFTPKSKQSFPTTHFRNELAWRTLVRYAYELRMVTKDGGTEKLVKMVVHRINDEEIRLQPENVFETLHKYNVTTIACYYEEKKKSKGITSEVFS